MKNKLFLFLGIKQKPPKGEFPPPHEKIIDGGKKPNDISSDGVTQIPNTGNWQPPKLVGLSEVETFFLNLYRKQLGEKRDEKGLVTWTQDKRHRSGRIYKLDVKHKGQWQSRHMTIRPIGDISHSKSQCFYVIFDTHIVVKIPPSIIKDFPDYLLRIQYEKTLVEKLSPCVCVIPNISVILSRIQTLSGTGAIPAKNQEEKYIRFLNAAPEHQESLKIGGAFAFFMDLSKHLFLSGVLADLQNAEGEIKRLVSTDVSTMFQGYDFIEQYGPENAQACLDLQDMYSRFESGLVKTIKPEEQLKISEKQKREWFIAYLTGDAITGPTSPELSDAILAEIKRLLKEIATSSGETVKRYQQIVKDQAAQLVFQQNLTQIEELASSLLELLVYIYSKNISLRDLKPDNLLIAGKNDNYPLFLLSAEDYSIGLIDLETAIDYESPDNPSPGQPRLGGTPAYATPSHFVSNPVLKHIYNNLPRIFHLQDWHAMIGIIYEAVTGHRLFFRTGGKIPLIILSLKTAMENKTDLKQIYWELNKAFWQSAKVELIEKVSQNRSLLSKVKIRVPEPIKEQIVSFLISQSREKEHVLLVSSQPDYYRFILPADKLLELMFDIVTDAMDTKCSSHNGPDTSAKATSLPTLPDLMTRSIGLTLTIEFN